MESALISLVSVALVIIAMVTMTMSFFQSANTISDSWRQMEQQAGNIRRTEINAASPSYQAATFDLWVTNDGHTNLVEFPKWDIIAQYQSGGIDYQAYIDYTTSSNPGNNEWTVEGIYLSDNITEVFDPNILNPGEKMKVTIKLSPALGQGDTGRITVSTPNGVTSQCLLTR